MYHTFVPIDHFNKIRLKETDYEAEDESIRKILYNLFPAKSSIEVRTAQKCPAPLPAFELTPGIYIVGSHNLDGITLQLKRNGNLL